MKNQKKSGLKRWSIVTLFFLCVSNFMLAQGIKVKGVVTDTTNEPLIGAAVTVRVLLQVQLQTLMEISLLTCHQMMMFL